MSDAKKLEELRARSQQLNVELARANAQVDVARGEYARLREEAKSKFGTDDINQLTEKLESVRRENARKLAEFEKSVIAGEDALAKFRQEIAKIGEKV